jgi:predicted nucleic acid-binding protein
MEANMVSLGIAALLHISQGNVLSVKHSTYLTNKNILVAGNTFQDVIEAAKNKGQSALSYADCFAVTTAIKEKATVVTGDPEFKKVDRLVGIDWLGVKKE